MPASAQLIVIVLALVAFWFVIMAPARRQQKKVANLQQEIGVGDQVVISAGIFGTIRSVEGSKVTLEVAPGVVLTVARQVVVRRQDADAPADAAGSAPGTASESAPDTAPGTGPETGPDTRTED